MPSPDKRLKLVHLNALRAFEAAARHLSIVAAADELNVTASAVSQQVQTLEDYLGNNIARLCGIETSAPPRSQEEAQARLHDAYATLEPA